ncbi:Coiled-coil domain-containing 90b protein, partial [Thalictrum thalictroides]
MAIAASCSARAVQQIGLTSSVVTEIHRRLLLSNLSSSSSSPLRHMSQLAKSPGKQRAFLVDTLAMVRGLESQGVPSNQAEAITSALTQVTNDSSENVAQSFISKLEMQK